MYYLFYCRFGLKVSAKFFGCKWLLLILIIALLYMSCVCFTFPSHRVQYWAFSKSWKSRGQLQTGAYPRKGVAWTSLQAVTMIQVGQHQQWPWPLQLRPPGIALHQMGTQGALNPRLQTPQRRALHQIAQHLIHVSSFGYYTRYHLRKCLTNYNHNNWC